MDWSWYNGNKYPVVEIIDIILAYVTAMSSVPAAGENLAKFLEFLRINKEIQFDNVTIVSHSLGCHGN